VTAINTVLWAELRRRTLSWATMTLLVALAGGATLACVAGARRTESAYPRFLRSARAADVVLYLGASPAEIARITDLPQVEAAATGTGFAMT
jgi:hypothetical protein